MYICQHCNKTISSHTRSFLFPLKTRTKTYPERPKIHTVQKDGKTYKKDDPGGTGQEIIKEIQVCGDCYQKLSQNMVKKE